MRKYCFGLGTLALALIVALVLAVAPVAFAGTGDDVAAPGVPWQQIVGLLASALVPVAVGLLTRKSWAWYWKALIAAAFAAAIGAATSVAAGAWNGDVWQFIMACYGVALGIFATVIQNVPGLKDKLYATFNKDPLPD